MSLNLGHDAILRKNPSELLNWLDEEFKLDIPQRLDNVQQLEHVEILLSKFGSQISYLQSLLSHAKLEVRRTRREELSKLEIEDAIDKKENIERALKGVEALRDSISRMLTARQEINRIELYMPTTQRCQKDIIKK